jgi:hypothetical protein
MTCTGLEDRVFDEDCRAALLGRGAMPPDVALHVARCPACARQWSQAMADARRFSEELLLDPPPALRRRLYHAFRRNAGARSGRIDVEILFRTIVAGALGASLAGGAHDLPDWAGFCVGASVGLVSEAVRRAPRSWLAPLASVARALRGCAGLLRPI